MKIYDILQELFTCEVFPGDPEPTLDPVRRMAQGDRNNMSGFSMGAHNGTHVDAPFHFIANGRTVDKIALETFIGPAYVTEFNGGVNAATAREMLDKAVAVSADAAKRLLIKGKAVVSIAAAEVFAAAGLLLLGNESQTFGPDDARPEVHKILLGADVVLLEGIRLNHVPEGEYLLNAAPINLGGCEGAPCRAVLIK